MPDSEREAGQGFVSTGLFLVVVTILLVLGAAITVALWPSAIQIAIALSVVIGLFLIVIFAGDLRSRD